MDIARLIEEFLPLNAKAKDFQLTPEEFVRWGELKEALIDELGRAPPAPPPQGGPLWPRVTR
jgi:hypothetical protein